MTAAPAPPGAVGAAEVTGGEAARQNIVRNSAPYPTLRPGGQAACIAAAAWSTELAGSASRDALR